MIGVDAMDPIKVDFSKGDGARKKEIVIPPEKAALKIILSIIGSVIVAAVAFYVMLPAINFKSYDFYIYLAVVVASFVVFLALLTGATAKPEYIPYVRRKAIVPAILVGLIGLAVGIGWLASCVFFRADDYSNLISSTYELAAEQGAEVETFNGSKGIIEADFSEELNEETASSFSSIPKLDENAAAELSKRALSSLASLGKVSQFTVYPEYTQINYESKPVRVVPLQYANIIKWFTNTSEGLPGYIIVDMAEEKTEFVECTDEIGGYIKYSPAEHFNELLKRHLRFEYPTYMFGDSTFEIDENGKPYWVCPVIDKTIGVFGGTDVIGIVLCAADGTCTEYTIEEVIAGEAVGEDGTTVDLTWLDRVYDSDLLVEQYDYFGKYNGGFWNSVLGQKNVYVTTSGYNYVAKDDDVYLYTGVTSVTSDDSITGFILINQRTKQSNYYEVPGGTEASAQNAAQGRVKEKGYTATFPLLLNIGGEPTYFLSLKDDSDIVQQYALINVKQYNNIGATSESLTDCLAKYVEDLEKNEVDTNIDADDVAQQIENEANGVETPEKPEKDEKPVDTAKKTVSGKVAVKKEAVISGNTVYYIKLDSSDAYYCIEARDSEEAIILSTGDTVTVAYTDGTGAILEASAITIG